MNLVKPVCPHCKSDNVRMDASVEFDVTLQKWVLSDEQDFKVFGTCGEETEKFNEVAVTAEDLPSIVLFDGEVKDWNIDEVDDKDKAKYRLTINQSVANGHIDFEVTPVELTQYQSIDEWNGLGGIIEVRNVKPAMSIGLSPHDLGLYIESNVASGLFVHSDNNVHISRQVIPWSVAGEKRMSAEFYDFESNADWLMDTQNLVAEKEFDKFDFHGEDSHIKDVSEWRIKKDVWEKTATIEKIDGDEAPVEKTLRVAFRENLPSLSSVTLAD